LVLEGCCIARVSLRCRVGVSGGGGGGNKRIEEENRRRDMHYVDYQIDVFFCEFCQVEAQCASGTDDCGCEAASRVRGVWGLR
jgi:hypothetical protein